MQTHGKENSRSHRDMANERAAALVASHADAKQLPQRAARVEAIVEMGLKPDKTELDRLALGVLIYEMIYDTRDDKDRRGQRTSLALECLFIVKRCPQLLGTDPETPGHIQFCMMVS